MLSAMRVPLLDLSEQYRTLAKQFGRDRHRLASHVLSSDRTWKRSRKRSAPIAARAWHRRFIWDRRASGDLMALEIGPGDAVITTAYTFFAPRMHCTASEPGRSFVDIDPRPATSRRSDSAYLAENCQANADGGFR